MLDFVGALFGYPTAAEQKAATIAAALAAYREECRREAGELISIARSAQQEREDRDRPTPL